MRIRNLKPEFFLHEGIAALSIQARVFFPGLWCVADREGRFHWRPKRLKAEIFPYDDFDVSGILEELTRGGFVHRYTVAGVEYGIVLNWARHQIPARDEPPSEIPAPDGSMTEYSRPPNQTVRARIYQRDHYRCAYCGRDMSADSRARVLDHVIPYSKNGTNNEKNLVTACKPCNAQKADRTPTEAGFKWPHGLGETYEKQTGPYSHPPPTVVAPPVNGVLTDGQQSHVLLREREGEIGKGKEQRLAPTAPTPFRASDLMELWNATMKPPIPRCREVTEERRRKIRARIAKRPSMSEWREIFEYMLRDAFYGGKNERGWVADFDYVIRNDTVGARILERAQAGHGAVKAAWRCPHEPACGKTAWECQRDWQLAQARKDRAS